MEFIRPTYYWHLKVFHFNLFITNSIDTTCTIWDLEKEAITTQLVAHEKEVFDIAFGHDAYTFVTAGADGSIRKFDSRSLEHSEIIYESMDQSPFLRVSWNRVSPDHIAVFTSDSTLVTIIDLRYPTLPFAQLNGHIDSVNAICWEPTKRYFL